MIAPELERRRAVQARRLFAIESVIAFSLLIWLGLGMTFFADEWAFIESRSLADPGTWFTPHNEHWSTLPILLYRLLVETVGIGSYVPYLAVVAALHIAVAWLVYLQLERSSGPIIAVAGGTIILLFGSGFENLYWGFQIGFIGSLALGLAAMRVTDGPATTRRALIVCALLIGSLMTSGVGLVMCVAVGVEWVLDRRWWPRVPFLVIPAATYLVWLLIVGRASVGQRRDPFTFEAIRDVPRFVADGIGNAVTAVTGLPALVGVVAIAILLTIVWRSSTTARPAAARAAGLGAALVAMYALSGLVRAQTIDTAADYPRYTYVAGVLMMVLLGIAIGRVSVPEHRQTRLLMVAGISAWLTASLLLNVSLLVLGRVVFFDRAAMTRALTMVALDPGRPPGVNLDRSLVLVPSPAALDRIVDRWGDPRTDSLAPWAVRPIPPPVLVEAARRLIEGAPIPGVTD